MPTGYTYPVCEGKITEFKDFALSCARGFGALITMRGEPMDAPIPDEIKPETKFYDEKLAADQHALGALMAMTNAEAEAAAKAAHESALKSRADYLVGQDAEAARLNAMLAKVRAWEPPTPDHAPMKSFMIEQLTMSLPGSYAPAIPELLDGATWKKREGGRLAESIVRSKKSIAEEIERARGRSEWLRNLRASLAA